MKRIDRLVASILLAMGTMYPTASFAQVPPPDEATSAKQDAFAEKKANKLDRQQQEIETKTGDAASRVQLTATNGQSEVELRLTHDLSKLSLEKATTRSSISVAIKAPAQKKADATTLASLDGLANNSRIEFTYVNTALKGLAPKAAKVVEIDAVCLNLLDYYKEAMASEDIKYKESKDAFKDFKLEALQNKAGVPLCGRDIAALYEGTGILKVLEMTKKLRNLLRPITEKAALHSWGLTATLGYDDFTYYDATTLAKSDSRKQPWDIGAFYSYTFLSDASRLSLAVKLENAYKAAKAETRCPVPTGTLPVTCVSGSFTAPNEKRSHIVSTEYRKILESGKYAWALSVNRDFKNKVTGVELPLYFLRSEQGFVNGGITLGWTSEDKKATVGLFIGKPFDLF